MGLHDGRANSLAISSADPSTLYAATDIGVYKYDGDWSLSGLDGLYVTAIALHPQQETILFAGTSSGAYVSSDGGLTWQPGPGELDGVWVHAIQVDPNNPDIIYFTTEGHGILRLSP